VDLVPTGIGTYEFRAQIIEPALQSIHAMSRPDSAWVLGNGVAAYGSSLELTPAGAIGNTPSPTYVWSDTGAGSTYDFYLSNTANEGLLYVPGAVPTCNGATCSYTPIFTLNSGSYKWQVQSVGKTTWGTGNSFSVALTALPVAVAQTLPVGAGAAVAPTYTWVQDATATSYNFYLQNAASEGLLYNVPAAATCTVGVCTYTPAFNLAAGSYTWFVQAVNAAGAGPWGTGMAFSH
jgi:hypothetical protein